MSWGSPRTLPFLALALAMAGCGGTTQAPAPSGSLYQQARSEGQVLWYSPEADGKLASAIHAFETAYPGVKVTHAQKTAQQQLPDIQVQQAAHHVSFDVGQASETNASEAIANHIYMTANWAALGVPQDRVVENGLLKTGSTPLAWVYNTQKVAAQDAPKTWDALLDPRWQGKMDLDGRGGFMSTFLAAPQLGGAAAGLEFAKKLAAQQPLFEASSPPIEAKIVSGEVSVGVDVASSALTAQEKKAPIDFAPVSPVDAALAFSFVVAGAPHPAAGQLLAAWLASPAGQAALGPAANSMLGDCADRQSSAVTQAFCARKIEWVQFSTLEQFQQIAGYQKQIQQIFGTRVGG